MCMSLSPVLANILIFETVLFGAFQTLLDKYLMIVDLLVPLFHRYPSVSCSEKELKMFVEMNEKKPICNNGSWLTKLLSYISQRVC